MLSGSGTHLYVSLVLSFHLGLVEEKRPNGIDGLDSRCDWASQANNSLAGGNEHGYPPAFHGGP